MASFSVAFKRTKKFEGGYVNNPNDSGKETYNGISRVHNPTWKGWRIVDEMKEKPNFPGNLSQRKAELANLEMQLYKNNYWNPIWGDKIHSQDVANDLYDYGVNTGVVNAIKMSQRVFDLPQTGRMDGQLLYKLNSIR